MDWHYQFVTRDNQNHNACNYSDREGKIGVPNMILMGPYNKWMANNTWTYIEIIRLDLDRELIQFNDPTIHTA